MFIMLSDVSVTGSELPLLSTASFGVTGSGATIGIVQSGW